MSFHYEKLLPTPQEIIAEYPLSPELIEQKAARDAEIADVFTGKSDKFILLGYKIDANGYCIQEIKTLTQSCEQPRHHIKKQRH